MNDRRNPTAIEGRSVARFPGLDDTGRRKLIFLVSPDGNFREDLTRRINQFGYGVQSFENIKEAGLVAGEIEPSALVMDIHFPDLEAALGIGEILEIHDGLPVIFVSDQNDFESRLQAVRFGARAFFSKPPDIGALVGELDRLTDMRPQEPYRVLLVEQAPNQAMTHASILRTAGIVTEVLRDPLKVADFIRDFNPELIIFNLYYPECMGMELATMLRQQDKYHNIPIVFLGRETTYREQMAAMQRGGDVFLELPVNDKLLVSSVIVRCERSRTLEALLVTDNLTGLLNHTALMERLEQKLSRVRKKGGHLSYAMIDIDRFTAVNNTRGQAAGDNVIKNLARLLGQRLRNSDFIGRYGGEEFGIVLTDTDAETALRVMDGIRAGFEKIKHYSYSGEFYCAFSCGVAAFPDFQDPREISKAADQALYQAKQNGRNRVCRAEYKYNEQ